MCRGCNSLASNLAAKQYQPCIRQSSKIKHSSTRQHCAAICSTCAAGQQPIVAPCQTSSLSEEKWWGCSSAEWLRRNCTTLLTKAARPGSSRAPWEMMGVPWLSRLLASRLLASVACCPSSPTCANMDRIMLKRVHGSCPFFTIEDGALAVKPWPSHYVQYAEGGGLSQGFV